MFIQGWIIISGRLDRSGISKGSIFMPIPEYRKDKPDSSTPKGGLQSCCPRRRKLSKIQRKNRLYHGERRRFRENVKLVPYIPDHLKLIEFNEWDRQVNPNEDHVRFFSAGPAFTLFKDGQIVVIGGVARLWKGVGEAWVLPGNGMKNPLLFHKTVSRILETIQEAEEFHRIQAIVFEDFAKGHKWVKALGFKSEGLLIAYGPNRENAIRYARVKCPS